MFPWQTINISELWTVLEFLNFHYLVLCPLCPFDWAWTDHRCPLLRQFRDFWADFWFLIGWIEAWLIGQYSSLVEYEILKYWFSLLEVNHCFCLKSFDQKYLGQWKFIIYLIRCNNLGFIITGKILGGKFYFTKNFLENFPILQCEPRKMEPQLKNSHELIGIAFNWGCISCDSHCRNKKFLAYENISRCFLSNLSLSKIVNSEACLSLEHFSRIIMRSSWRYSDSVKSSKTSWNTIRLLKKF